MPAAPKSRARRAKGKAKAEAKSQAAEPNAKSKAKAKAVKPKAKTTEGQVDEASGASASTRGRDLKRPAAAMSKSILPKNSICLVH